VPDANCLAMEKPQTDGDQSPVNSDTDVMDCLNFDGHGDVEDPHKEVAKGEQQPSGEVDEQQSVMDVDLTCITSVGDEGNEKQNAMDVDLKEILSEEDGGEGKASSDLPSQVPVDFNVASLEKFCKEAARSFFSETGLVSHQINSYDHFVSHGLQELFDSLGEITVEPDYDPSNKHGAWKHATVKFGRVKLDEPVFMLENSDLEEQDLKFKPRHARLQKMTYASRMNVEMTVQVRMS
jgi:DNA-directed RNA polymerase IV and V subunit 2